MKEREKIVVSGLVILFLLLWLGFAFHTSPRFAGSLTGGIFAVVGSVLMLVPLLYMIVKRIPFLRGSVTKHISMRTLLDWHIYAGVIGPILVIIHTGHKFESALGIALTAMTILVVVSGFVGRYLMSMFSSNIREQKKLLTDLGIAYRQAAADLSAHPEQLAAVKPFSGFFSRILGGIFSPMNSLSATSPIRVLYIAEAISDVEYGIKTNQYFKSWFAVWLKFHIIISFILYALLFLHVWAGLHFGLRWFK